MTFFLWAVTPVVQIALITQASLSRPRLLDRDNEPILGCYTLRGLGGKAEITNAVQGGFWPGGTELGGFHGAASQ